MSEDQDDMTGSFNSRPRKEALAPEDFDLIVDKETALVWVLHDKPLLSQDRIKHAEYDSTKHSLRFISHDGAIQYLGADVQPPLQPHLARASEIRAVLMDEDGSILNMFSVPLEVK